LIEAKCKEKPTFLVYKGSSFNKRELLIAKEN
jgi:hypothetical protein